MTRRDPVIDLRYPFTAGQTTALRVGTRVRIDGLLYTGRDRLHQYLADGHPAPASLRNGAMYHCGPVVEQTKAGWRILAAGPTTSMRQESFMDTVLAIHGVRLIIGKGGMGRRTTVACHRYGAVYVQVVGGAAARLAASVTSVRGVWFLDEFGATEALWAMEVEGFEGVVTIDAHGGNLNERVRRRSRQALRQLYSDGPDMSGR